MPGAAIRVIDGISYPRDVEVPDCLPPGWRCVEQAYGPNSKSAGNTYQRYTSLDGRHKSLAGPKQVIQKHCEDLGIPWEPEYAKYERAMEEKQAVLKEAKRLEREARGECSAEKREEMIQVSRAKLGELTGKIVLGFPGWKCRWDFLPESGQCPKTFLSPDGREWKLLKDVECMFGVRLTEGGTEADKILKMVEVGIANVEAHALFSTGSQMAKECGGSYLLDPENPAEGVVQTAEETAARKAEEREAKRLKRGHLEEGGINSLTAIGFNPVVCPAQVGWTNLTSPQDLEKGFAEFRSLLQKRKFPNEVELVAVREVAESRFAARISGIYYRLPAKVSGRSCYQKLLFAPRCPAGICCDGVYILWNASETRWQLSVQPLETAPCIAYCEEDQAHVTSVVIPWMVQQRGYSDFKEDLHMKAVKS